MSKKIKKSVSHSVMERLKVLDNLPHFPDALMKLEKILSSDEDIFLEDVSALVSQDPRLTAGVIGVVNSARYSKGTKISSLGDAVNLIGLKDVRMMAHAINYKSTIKTKPPFSEKEFMDHAMTAAFIGQALAKEVHINEGEGFLCGLMHDIGIYLLATENRESYKKVIKAVEGDVDNLLMEESKAFQVIHPMMGARLLKQWKFPDGIIMGVAGHHRPDKTDNSFKDYAFLTYLTEQGAFILGGTNGVVGQVSEQSEMFHDALEHFGLAPEMYDDLIQDALLAVQEAGLV